MDYSCTTCGSLDGTKWQRCEHPNCPDGRDQSATKVANVTQLVPGKSDKEVAAELKAEIVLGAQAYLDICTKAAKLGFMIQMQCGPNAFGETVIQQLVVSKQY